MKKTAIYIGHLYHLKTNSTRFLIDFIGERYNVEEMVYEDSQNIDEVIYEKILANNYDLIVFFQKIIELKYLNLLKSKNIIYFPMYDHNAQEDYQYWNQFRNIKTINFSKSLHTQLTKWGHKSLVVQYFPKLSEFKQGDKNKVYFWQRNTKYNINLLEKILGDKKCTLYLHRALDPHESFISPTQEQEKKYQIQYSEWFENKAELDDLIASCGIYVAPRKKEGIGQSFLQAMAMGKYVIANDASTMNEYITHGKTGFLIDYDNPQRIDLNDIEQVQKQCYEYMQNGFEIWNKEKYKIFDFIDMPLKTFRKESLKTYIPHLIKRFLLSIIPSFIYILTKICIGLYLLIKQLIPYLILKKLKKVPPPVCESLLLGLLPYRVVRILQKRK